jgi:nitrogenase cofactor biosynthesis protein NifB
MPMGSVTAFCGIAGCMTVLHGSQGCATYIRRHMATHFNEPIDVASSSLTEEGTVFGGEKNLVKGIENLIKLYDPEVIGISTTCLAETIGEDVPAMLARFRESHPGLRAKLVSVASAGYSGTQFEGFFRTLRALAEQVAPNPVPNGKVNIITGQISPADTRWLKGLLAEMNVAAILLPDLSENLDGGYEPEYHRLKRGGATLAEIAQMAGAKLSIELSTFAGEEYSPARLLFDKYGVPFKRLNLPMGLRDTDALIDALKSAGGTVTERLRKERGRYLDAMIDSHKYNAKVKAAVFGEPDMVYSIVRLLSENGAFPAVCATGSECPRFAGQVSGEIERLCSLNPDAAGFEAADGADFAAIEGYCRTYGVNMLIGSGDGRRVAEKLKLPLVRCAFPVHDHVGGQRVRTLGYEGSLTLLDRVTNELLNDVENTFREELRGKYYVPDKRLTTEQHPCFSRRGGSCARIHLPVAPECNIQCVYCVRKFDCPNESRPGVTSEVLTPAKALEKFRAVRNRMPNLTVAGIAGPGDALANFEAARETLRLVRGADPRILFCVSTNGLMLPYYADELAELGVTHVTVTVNAVTPSVGARVYKYVEFMGERREGESGAAFLLANQLAGIALLTARGVAVKVNTVMIKGVNDRHIPEIMRVAKELGCKLGNIMPVIPADGGISESVSVREIAAMRERCEPLLPQMYHCKQCRADAAGTLADCGRGDARIGDAAGTLASGGDNEGREKRDDGANRRGRRPAQSGILRSPGAGTPCLFAVSSKNGTLVDQHFGHAKEFYIYEYRDGGVRFKERRSAPQYCVGDEDQDGRMRAILRTLDDCVCVLAARIGDLPRGALLARGIQVHTTYDRIEDAVKEALKLI